MKKILLLTILISLTTLNANEVDIVKDSISLKSKENYSLSAEEKGINCNQN